MRRHKRLTGLIALCPLLLLAACASNPVAVRTITVHTPVIVPVPSAYTDPVQEPQLHGNTNGDLAAWALALRQALRDANGKLKKIAGLKP